MLERIIPLTPGRASRRAPAAAPLALLGLLALAGCARPGGAAPNGQATAHVADAALNAGYPQMALNVANAILARNPRSVSALTAQADALYALHRQTDAAAAYRKALAIAPEDAAANAGLARILVTSDPHGAERLLRTALRTRPEDPVALANLGVALDLQERHVEAQAEYRRALQIAPGATATKANLGLSLALSGDTAGAEAVLGPVAAAPDAPASARDNLAVARMLATAPPAGGAPTPLAAAPAPAPGAAAFVQLGAADSETGAQAMWQRVRGRNQHLLGQVTPEITSETAGSHTVWRIRVPAASLAEARHMCARIQRQGNACWVGTAR